MTTTPTAAHPLSAEDLDHLQVIHDAATPGQWSWWTSNSQLRLTADGGPDGGVLHAYNIRGCADISCSASDRAFIATARNAMASLIAQARAALPDQATGAVGGEERPTPDEALNLSGLTREAIIEIAQPLFGWVAGCGGFEDAVLTFATHLSDASKRARAAASQAAPGVGAEPLCTLQSAFDAIDFMEQHNGPGRAHWALGKLKRVEATALPAPAQPAGAAPFGIYMERNDGTTEFQRTGKAFQPSACGGKSWTLYDGPHAPVVRADVLDAVRGYMECVNQLQSEVEWEAASADTLTRYDRVRSRLQKALAAPHPPVVRTDVPAEIDPDALQEQSEAWFAVCDVLHEVATGWHSNGKTGEAAAVATIRKLAASPSPSAPQGQAAPHVATVEAGKFANRLQWVSDGAMAATPVGSKLYAAPVAGEAPADARDAARYRWLRNPDPQPPRALDVLDDDHNIIEGKKLDAAIDAAMSGHDSANGGERSKA